MSAEDQSQLLRAMHTLTLTPKGASKGNQCQSEHPETSSKDAQAELETMFLAPEKRFPDDWLNKLQQYYPPLHLTQTLG
jgi:hypothetical protein